ncbi:MAG: hypothetical protein ACLSHO_05270 [Dysosmobacter sp.]
MKYQKWHIGTASEQDTALLKEAGYPSLLATVLAARGITTSEAAAEALERETSLTISPCSCGTWTRRWPGSRRRWPTMRPSLFSAITMWTASPPRCCFWTI